MTDQELRDYVAQNRDSLHYALREGDRWARTVVLAALVAAGDAEIELAKQELKNVQQREQE